MKDILTIIGGTLCIFAIIALVIWGLTTLRMTFDRRACDAVQANSNTESKYLGYYEGCYVKVNGRFIPQSNWRGEYEK